MGECKHGRSGGRGAPGAGAAPAGLTIEQVKRMMQIRMTGFGAQISALLAAGVAAAGGLVGVASNADMGDGRLAAWGHGRVAAWDDGRPIALIVDAAQARDGRDLVDPRLEDVDAEVRLPRTDAEARTDVRYFDAQGYHVVVAGPLAEAAVDSTGVPARQVQDLDAGLSAIGG
jgi:hypothetical protein